MKKCAVIFTICCFILSGCTSVTTARSIAGGPISGSQTSYFDHYHSRTSNDKYFVEGTVHQGTEDHNAVLAYITANEDTTALFTGTAERVKGDLQLVYTTDDGSQILIADTDDQSVDVEIAIPKGSGKVHFKGNGEKAVYDFNLRIELDGNAQIKDLPPEELKPPEELGLPENPELPLGPPEIEVPDSEAFPNIHDNWPEDITFENHGTYADALAVAFEIDEPVTLSISCVTTGGKMDMKIVGPNQTVYYDKSDIKTGDDTVEINTAGTYQVVLRLEYHEGSIVIRPD